MFRLNRQTGLALGGWESCLKGDVEVYDREL